jgi:hypothetical protein
MSLEQQIAALVDSTTALTQEVSNKQAQVDARVAAKINELEAWRGNHLNEHPAIAVNFNARMTALGGTAPQQLPLAMGVHAGGDFWSKFDVTLIPVTSGLDPITRPPVVRELLQYMNMDSQYFHGGFNILKLTVKSIANSFGPFVFYTPYQHIFEGAFNSFVVYHKIVGKADWRWMDNAKKEVWNQVTHHIYASDAAGAYTHIDIGLSGSIAVGDTLYLALPQVIAGKWNPQHRCPQVHNIYDAIIDVVGSGNLSGLGGTFAGINSGNR